MNPKAIEDLLRREEGIGMAKLTSPVWGQLLPVALSLTRALSPKDLGSMWFDSDKDQKMPEGNEEHQPLALSL